MLLTVIGLAAIVVLRLTGNDSDAHTGASPDTEQAQIVAAPVTTTPQYVVVPGSVLFPDGGTAEQATEQLPEPEGRCSESDIQMTPTTVRSRAGDDVVWEVLMRTKVAAACTFTISPSSMQLRVTSGSNVIWSTLDCPGALTPKQQVVIGASVETPVIFTWSGKRSSSRDCTEHGSWAKLGTYKLTIAVLGGRVAVNRFELT